MHQPKIYPLAVLLASGLLSSTLAAPTSNIANRAPQPQGTSSEPDPSELVIIPIDVGTEPSTVEAPPAAEPDPITVAPSTGGSGGGGVGGSGTGTGGSSGVSARGLMAVRNVHGSAEAGKRAPHPGPQPQTEGLTSTGSSSVSGLDPSELVVIPIEDPALPPVDTSGVAAGLRVRARKVGKTF
ncbi:hypothetical protein V8F20_005610 [Naviculisporaceae sp. PSN 640]